jgi:hypothetical protein
MLGQEVLDRTWVIDSIIKDDSGSISIWIIKSGEIIKWKTFSSNVPTSIEFKIDF